MGRREGVRELEKLLERIMEKLETRGWNILEDGSGCRKLYALEKYEKWAAKRGWREAR